ncbi:MAG: hypothetical protein ABFQ62_03130 [Patescibacteria group bacterium]
MLSIAHGVTGAFIATKIGNPLISFPIIIASHFFEDWLPHWDVGTGLSRGLRTKKDAFLYELVDLAVMSALLYWFWQLGNPEIAWQAYYGAFVGLLPDFIAAPKVFLNINLFFAKPIDKLHDMFHNSIPHKLLGLIPQAIVVLVIYFLR